MFLITRETIYMINVRQAYLLSTWNCSRISSKTVLFTSVPEDCLTDSALHSIFPLARRIWFATDCQKLTEKVDERDDAASKLENAEIQLSADATKRRNKAQKDKEHTSDGGESGRQWPNTKKRPTHRLKPIIGEKVDTIEWARDKLKKLVPEIEHDQELHTNEKELRVPAVFIEFVTQQAAQTAYAMVAHNEPKHIIPRKIGVLPGEVVWKNLRIKYWEGQIRWLLATAFISAMILFWSIPVAFVGILTNVNYLTENVPFLRWIDDIPGWILGTITGLLPTVLLAVLMVLVPIICNLVAKQAGCVTLSEVELQTQNWYFAFQVIQVFLITTFTSGATAVASQIVSDPTSAVTLLAKNLPKASNFYLSYFILYGIAMSAKTLFNAAALIMSVVVARFTDKSPRKMYNRYIQLAGLGWGSVYPKWTNLAVIALAYSCIAPLVLGFATIGLGILYLVYRHNFLYVYTTNVDTKGQSYARALQHLTVGVYLSELCLIGLFAINTGDQTQAVGPLILMVIFLIATVLYHLTMRHALGPLIEYLPGNLMVEAHAEKNMSQNTVHGRHEGRAGISSEMSYTEHDTSQERTQGMSVANGHMQNKEEPSMDDIYAFDGIKPLALNSSQADARSTLKSKLIDFCDPTRGSARAIAATLHPSLHCPAPPLLSEDIRNAYYSPVITSSRPLIWIVRDDMGISQKEVEDTRRDTDGLVDITDEQACFDDNGNVVWNRDAVREAPLWEGRKVY